LIATKLRIIKESFYNEKLFHHLQSLIETVNQDVAYVLQYGTTPSTSIFVAIRKNT